jgi:GTP-binding protein YchF
MGFTCGIVGLPNVGKSTLFNAITAAGAHVANYPFCTIEPNVGIVTVPDRRLDKLSEIYNPPKVVPTTLEFIDIAGLVKGANKGEGLGNQFLSHIRTVDAIVHIVRCFDDPNIIHVNGPINPKYDIEVIETELILKDLETIEKRLSDTEKRSKTSDKKIKSEIEFYINLKNHLLSGRSARHFILTNEDTRFWLRDLQLLTNKPVMYVCNVHEKDLPAENIYVKQVHEIAAKDETRVVVISAAVEAEIAELPKSEQLDFLSGLGLKESGLSKVIREGYNLLHLITFFTSVHNELHAWTIQKGTTAPQAAGKIHTDFEHGFIRAEIIKFADLDRLGSETAIKDAGLLHIVGHDYIIEDGDVMFVRFNV